MLVIAVVAFGRHLEGSDKFGPFFLGSSGFWWVARARKAMIKSPIPSLRDC